MYTYVTKKYMRFCYPSLMNISKIYCDLWKINDLAHRQQRVQRSIRKTHDFAVDEKTLKSVMRCAICTSDHEDGHNYSQLVLNKGCYIGAPLCPVPENDLSSVINTLSSLMFGVRQEDGVKVSKKKRKKKVQNSFQQKENLRYWCNILISL